MKLKNMAVIGLLVLCCGVASGQTYSLSFGSGACEYETFTVTGSVAAGTDFLTGCGSSFNGVLVGFATDLPASGGPVTGKVVIFADNNLDASASSYTGCQIILVTKTKPSSKKYGWADYLSCGDGVSHLLHYGYLTARGAHATGGNRSIGPIADWIKKRP